MAKTKHESVSMRPGLPFQWRAPSRRTRTWYVNFQCPECGATTRRNRNRSENGVVCTGTRQVAVQIGGRYRHPSEGV